MESLCPSGRKASSRGQKETLSYGSLNQVTAVMSDLKERWGRGGIDSSAVQGYRHMVAPVK